MPEMMFRVRWPDGKTEDCYSPSLVIKDYFSPGETYALADFLERARTALGIASERVKAKYGFACAHAMSQLAEIEATACNFSATTDPKVRVEAFNDWSGSL